VTGAVLHLPRRGRPDTAVDLAERYRAVRAATERLAAPLGPEDQTVQSMPEASPTKWHLAHVTWFFETFVLAPFAPDYRPLIRPSPISSTPTTRRWVRGTRARRAV
jgi:hypothetical protein